MKELIKVATNAKNEQVVSAKELYIYLGYDKSHWASWYKINIESNQFALQDVDYQVFAVSANTQGGRPTVDFALTIDFAKRLSMMARTETGEKARLYFIECERKLENQHLKLPATYKEALLALVQAEEEKEALQLKALEDEPKVLYYDNVLAAEDAILTTHIANELGMTAVTLNKKLHDRGIIYKFNGVWTLYSKYKNKGFTKTKTYVYEVENVKHTALSLQWTQKGREFIHSLFTE